MILALLTTYPLIKIVLPFFIPSHPRVLML
ncbi:hypothetical protein ID866_10503 [Astraeus odoratus]|nr:hypothetical protein ID866_10503 [Astraeus odoratus]